MEFNSGFKGLKGIFECAVVWRQQTRSSADLLLGLSVFCCWD